MPDPLYVPRVNNNDDSVRIVELRVKEGDFVKRGQILGAVETDKAVLDVMAERDGYILKILAQSGEAAERGFRAAVAGRDRGRTSARANPCRPYCGCRRRRPTAHRQSPRASARTESRYHDDSRRR